MHKNIDGHITLIGTAHISRESVAEVERAIDELRPDIVAVELDRNRYLALVTGRKWKSTSVYNVIRSGRGPLMLVQIFLATIQRRMGMKNDVPPGTEMLSAIRSARKRDIPVALVDRDITVTFKRGWQGMGFFEKLKLFWYGLGALFGGDEEELTEIDIEEMMREDVITLMIKDFREIAPGISKAFIDERDSFIALKLTALRDGTENPMKRTGRIRRVLKREGTGKKGGRIRNDAGGETVTPDVDPGSVKEKRVLGVLGAGHLEGVSNRIKRPEDTGNMEELSRTKKRRISAGKVLGYAVPVLFAFAVALLLYRGEYDKVGDVFIWWFLINGICSALGALLARGHVLSVLTAFIAAPLTSLNPLLAAGWFAGIVEANVRVPTVADMEELGNFERFRDFFNNRLVRVLMVAALANVGSVVGTYVGAAKIIEIVL